MMIMIYSSLHSSGFHDYFPICVRTWFNRCGTPIFTPLFEKLMVDVVRSRMVEVCSGDKRIKMDSECGHRSSIRC